MVPGKDFFLNLLQGEQESFYLEEWCGLGLHSVLGIRILMGRGRLRQGSRFGLPKTMPAAP